MHIVVTGGSGFIGRTLCIKLLDEGHTLTLLTRTPQNTAQLFLPHKINAINNLDDAATPVDAVINLAGEPIVDKRWTALQKEELINSRLRITQMLTENINADTIKPRVFISGSAVGFYGDGGDEVLDEHSTYHHEEFAHDLCKQWEEAALCAQHNTRVCILRIGIVLDEGGGALHKMLLPFRLGLGGKMGSGKQWFSWIHREDLVNLIIFILNNETCSGIFNGTAPKPVTNEQFTKTLGAALKRPTLFAVPSFVLGLLMGERADLLLKGQHVLPTRALGAGFSFKYPELGLALKAILK